MRLGTILDFLTKRFMNSWINCAGNTGVATSLDY